MKKSIFILLTFVYSAVFANNNLNELYHQTIKVVNNTHFKFIQELEITPNKFYTDTLLPYSTNVIKASATYADGNGVFIKYAIKYEIYELMIRVFDYVESPPSIDCTAYGKVTCNVTIDKNDAADYQATVTINQ